MLGSLARLVTNKKDKKKTMARTKQTAQINIAKIQKKNQITRQKAFEENGNRNKEIAQLKNNKVKYYIELCGKNYNNKESKYNKMSLASAAPTPLPTWEPHRLTNLPT